MPSPELLWEYFTSPIPLGILTMATGLLVAATVRSLRAEDPDRTIQAGKVALILAPFLWMFLGASIVFCDVYAEAYVVNELETVKNVVGWSTVAAVSVVLPFSAVLLRLTHGSTWERQQPRNEISLALQERFTELQRKMRLRDIQLAAASTQAVFAAGIEHPVRAVLISRGMTDLLSEDEMETVMAHELGHFLNGHSGLKSYVTAYRRVLPFDLIVRLIAPRLRAACEFVADAVAVRATNNPVALATALLKSAPWTVQELLFVTPLRARS